MEGTSKTSITLTACGWETHLCEANEEELMVGEAEGREGFLFPVLFQPVLIRLEAEEHSGFTGDGTAPATPHLLPPGPGPPALPGRQP